MAAPNRYPGVTRRCGCADPATKKKLGGECPKFANPRHGAWHWRADIGPGIDAKTGTWKERRQISGVAASAKKAADDRDEAVRKAKESGGAEDSVMSVAAAMDVAMQAKRVKGLAESTLAGYQYDLDLYILPRLGKLPLKDLRASHLEAMYVWILAGNPARIAAKKRPVNQPTIVAIHRTARLLLGVLVKRRVIPFNPARDVELTAPRRPTIVVWSAEQLVSFLDHVETADDPLAAAFAVAADLGLRRGELCGLRWSYVDLDTGVVTIPPEQGATRITVRNKATASRPKTRRSARPMVLTADTLRMLKAWLRRQRREQLASAEAWQNADGVVFTRADGSPWHPDTVSSRFETLSRHAGLPKIPVKNLRHTSASVALRARAETIEEVSRRLGHSTITITVDTYTDVSLAQATDAARRRGNAVRRQPRAHRPSHQEGTGVGPGVVSLSKDRGSSTSGRWGGWGSNPRPEDYELDDGRTGTDRE